MHVKDTEGERQLRIHSKLGLILNDFELCSVRSRLPAALAGILKQDLIASPECKHCESADEKFSDETISDETFPSTEQQ